ncbi:hypothetical protein M422DRAFT_268318 [Sphaerobolus stellatus SS14]|uniref:DUF5745 domain-containing protein n=1 Tax=Sphaerobolus stellatus (strain SS14) TaxID=990650 RepID=A0A0C9UMX1_SPHS4|nr:hypothetical protein M422DRAFT_268318 [Sphaerobolus stellatus SS14]
MEENTYHQYAYDDLVNELNALLLRLCLPITIDSPQDLTPSLLLAILESIIKERLPIPQTIRESNALDGKVLAMKLFLGVIETDILQRDLGLSNMDPRRLAAGELAEVVYIGRTLCLLGRDYLSFKEDVEENTGVVKVEENHISISRDRIVPNTRSSRYGDSETNGTTVAPSLIPDNSTVPTAAHPSPHLGPICIHEFDISNLSLDLSFVEDVSHHNHYPETAGVDNRWTGIDLISSRSQFNRITDEEKESGHLDGSIRSAIMHMPRGISSNISTRLSSPSQYTLTLLKERASLLEELAKSR